MTECLLYWHLSFGTVFPLLVDLLTLFLLLNPVSRRIFTDLPFHLTTSVFLTGGPNCYIFVIVVYFVVYFMLPMERTLC